MRRIPLHKIPNIASLGGILLSVMFATLSWGIGAASAVDSVIFGLIGTILSIQFEILVRNEEHHEFVELITGSEWLRGPIKRLCIDGAAIAKEYPDTPIEDEARHLLQNFCVDFGDLRLGRLRQGSDNSHYLIQHTRDAKLAIFAVTNVGEGIGNPRWWREERGRGYVKENIAAVQRGVSIQRVIIYSEAQREVAIELAKEQHDAGIQVRLALREALRPDQRINFAIWDSRISWEAQMNADGNPIANVYCVGAADIRRLTWIHHALWENSVPYVAASDSDLGHHENL